MITLAHGGIAIRWAARVERGPMPLPPNRDEAIAFLVQRKFRSVLAVLSSPPNHHRPNRTTTLDRALGAQERDRYRSELHVLPVDKLEALYDAECAAALEDIQREENARFFNLPYAAADFEHWSKMEHWSLDEAVALALGKAPEIVSWDKIKAFKDVSPFAERYARLRDLAERAKAWQKLYEPVLPLLFLKWAKENEIEVPVELTEKVEKLKGKLVDWKKEFEELKSAYDQLNTTLNKWRSMYEAHVADWKNVVGRRDRAIADATKRITDLEAELIAAKGVAAEAPRPQSPIERENMLKAIYVMASKGYGYNPDDKRSTVIADIVNDLSLAGLPLSDDTIRRYVKEARERLSEWQEQSS